MLQTFTYNNSPITFSKDAEVMINATEMAKPFGKEATHFLNNQQTKEFKSVLEAKLRIPSLRIQRGGSNPGTWMHQKLALKFAAWLSPEFELWVFDRIEELLLTGKTEVNNKSEEEIILQGYQTLLAQVETIKEQNKLLEITIKKQAPKAEYCDRVLDSVGLKPTTVMASELGFKSANALNKDLKVKGVMRSVGGTWVLTAKYAGKGYTQTKTHPYTDSLGQAQTSILTYWTERGRAFLHNLYNPLSKVA